MYLAAQSRVETADDPGRFDSHLVAALGIHWAHAVTIRLVLETRAGWHKLNFKWTAVLVGPITTWVLFVLAIMVL